MAKSMRFLMSAWINVHGWGWPCILHLMTGGFGDTSKAGATHLSQWRPVAQRLVHGVNNDTFCLCRQTKSLKMCHFKAEVQQGHRDPRASDALTLSCRSFPHCTQRISGQQRRAEVLLKSSCLTYRMRRRKKMWVTWDGKKTKVVTYE